MLTVHSVLYVGVDYRESHADHSSDDPEFHHVSTLSFLVPILTRSQIIRWDETGDLIIIERPDELADKILPQVYRQTRFASFSRQLNVSMSSGIPR